jgi:hypothetical protein
VDPLKLVDKVTEYLDKADQALQQDKIDVANAYMALADAAGRAVASPPVTRALFEREEERRRLRQRGGLNPNQRFLDPDDPRSPVVDDDPTP